MTDTADRQGLSGYELDDKYRRETGRVFLTGLQAVARLPLDQLRIDRRSGLNTAAFISGYQGSPVGTLGEDISRAARTVPDLPIVVQPGVNEELAATAVMGSQLAVTLDDCLYDGVLGMWYGKGPGIDRAGDAIRHGVFASTAPHGGVLAIVGDDPSAKSSTLPSSSDATMVDLHMPILFPGDVQETIDITRHGVALSRACGIWSGIKLVTQVADGTGTVDVHPERVTPIIPRLEVDGTQFVAHPNGKLITPYTLEMEREFFEVRTELAREYGALNKLNRVTVRSGDDWIGIAACGHTYHELREALEILGFPDDESLRSAGIRLFQLLMPVPLDVHDVREFAEGLSEIFIVEEKNPTLERLVRDALYDTDQRPRVWGKRDADGSIIVPFDGMLSADRLLRGLRIRLQERLGDRLRPEQPTPTRELIPLSVDRAPFFCSGCPHNASTRVAPGTLVGGGIGCHAMVAFMEPERVGDVIGLTCMGNEGAQWIGISPFVVRDHLVQNLGDGTFFHSGSIAVRAAVASGIDITYKLLHNGTVAMTGGQDAQGAIGVPAIAAMLMAEGVKRVIITADDPDRYDPDDLPDTVELWDRNRLAEAQEVLAGIKGTTVLIHDQACAAENRRGRSRGTIATPDFRVVINERVCEGCGDCGDKSNCLSVQPHDSEYGRKTAIHQTSCNFDFSCLQGDCPAFATVTVDDGPRQKRSVPTPPNPIDLPAPHSVLVDPERFTIRLSGIGGTGVVTVSQIIGTAAMLDGFEVRGLDQTGLSQKAGPVSSDIRITRGVVPSSNHANAAGVDCMLGFDLLAAASDAHRDGASPDRTIVIGSIDATPTGSMVIDPDRAYPSFDVLTGRMNQVSRTDANRYLDAAAITHGIFGSTTSANVLLTGAAVQAGAVGISPESLERAIELNGVAVDANIAAFRWGRQWALDPAAVERAAGITVVRPESTEQLIERLAGDLIGYQSKAYADRFRQRIDAMRAAERRVDPAGTTLTHAAARNLHKLMAYKDEYEVARLLLLDESRQRYEAVGGPGTTVTHHLHPPAMKAFGMNHKIKLRRSAGPSFRALRASKRLRGTVADPFRYGAVRRLERELIPEFEQVLDDLVARLDAGNLALAVEIAELPDQIRGYEELKLRRAAQYRIELAELLARFKTT